LAVAPADGWSVRNDVYYYGADGGRSVRSGQVEVGIDISLFYDYATFLYKPGTELLGGQLAFSGTLAGGHVDLDANLSVAGQPFGVSDDKTGLGDLTFGSYIYWPKDKWNLAWANYIVAPTGSYDVDEIANTGLNIWTFETDFMATYFDPEKGRDYSVVVGYSYNWENDDTNYQTGDEFHVDVVLNQFLSESFAIGLSAFHLRQLGGDRGSGAVLGDFKARASGIGPNFMWVRNIDEKDVAFILKWINEFDVEKRLEGDHVFASFAFSF
ncbi:MAG: SphA family protein, partial [Woeseiaceae bacterium]